MPHKIYDPTNKYDVSMARRGFYRCPYIGVYCRGPYPKKVIECKGEEECYRAEMDPRVRELFRWEE